MLGFLGDWRHTHGGRALVTIARHARSPRAIWSRRREAARALQAKSSSLRVDPKLGYVRFEPADLTGTDEHVAALAELHTRLRPALDAARAGGSDPHRLVAELVSDAEIARSPWLVDFALQDAILLAAIEYLGTVPFLARVSVAVSFHVPEWTEPQAFQRFHVDNEDARQIKVYFHPREIRPEHGPLSFLPADVSARVLKALEREGQPLRRKTTFRDEDVYRHCDRSELVVLTSPRGGGAIVDLSRCLHFGSRVSRGHERIVNGLTFLRHERRQENPLNHIDTDLARGDRLRELALLGPRIHPAGAFYPERYGTTGSEAATPRGP